MSGYFGNKSGIKTFGLSFLWLHISHYEEVFVTTGVFQPEQYLQIQPLTVEQKYELKQVSVFIL